MRQARQLRLFAGKRQRGVLPPPPKEENLHFQIADILRLWIIPPFRYTYMPMGEYRPKATAALLKRKGMTPSWPDFLIIGPQRCIWIECKRKGEKPTPEQIDMGSFLMAVGCTYILDHDLKSIITQLRDLGVVRARVT